MNTFSVLHELEWGEAKNNSALQTKCDHSTVYCGTTVDEVKEVHLEIKFRVRYGMRARHLSSKQKAI